MIYHSKEIKLYQPADAWKYFDYKFNFIINNLIISKTEQHRIDHANKQ